MRNRIYGKQLNRTSPHRKAMLKNLAAALFEHGSVETTMPKAKAVQPLIEKIITIAKRGGLHSRREIESKINDRRIFAWVADDNVPDSAKDNDYFDLPAESDIEFNRYGELRKSPRLVQHIMATVAPLFADRDGGYTRVIRTGRHRLGDATEIVILQLVGREEGSEASGSQSGRRKQADRRAAYAAKMAPAAAAPAAVAEAPPAEETSSDDAATDA